MKKLWLWHAPESTFDRWVNAFATLLRLMVVFFIGAFVGAIVNTVLTTESFQGGLWLWVTALVLFILWNLWDVAKSWGVVPSARVSIDATEIAFETPVWRRTLVRRVFTRGQPIELTVRERAVIKAVKTMHVYEFRQGDMKARYIAPMPITEESEKALRQALAKAGTNLKVPHIAR